MSKIRQVYVALVEHGRGQQIARDGHAILFSLNNGLILLQDLIYIKDGPPVCSYTS